MSDKQFIQSVYGYDSSKPTECIFEGTPEACPECKRGQDFPNPYFIRFGENESNCYAFYQCLFSNCRTPFFVTYIYIGGTSNNYFLSKPWTSSYIEDTQPVSAIINKISPQYKEIYTQAHRAENLGLNLIAGCGYRKALEFLIKDYCISLNSSDKEKVALIKSSLLGKVIKDYLNIPRITALANRATWLGNDETHYERRIKDGDIDVMKSLMRLLIHYIEAEEESKKLEQQIQPAK